MPKNYRAADWSITSNSALPVKLSLERIRQEIRTGPDVTILSRASSINVVADAQGSSPVSVISRVALGAVGGATAAQVAGIIPTSGWGSYVVLGAGGLTLLMQYIFPTLKSHAVESISSMLPDPVALEPFATQSGMVIVELSKGAKDPEHLDVTLNLQIGEKTN